MTGTSVGSFLVPVVVIATAAVGLGTAGPAYACGPETDCVVGDRSYRIQMPADHDGATPVGAVVYMHGYRGSSAGTMRNQSLRTALSDMGLALIAGDAILEDWSIANVPGPSNDPDIDELAYFDAVIADAADRFPIDTDRLMATGFSAGGMMVWTLACGRGDLFAAFAPIAGTFWAPVPETCGSSPVNLIHTHGTADEIVPLGGRPIAETHQGDVQQALELLASTGDFSALGPDYGTEIDGLVCRRAEAAGGEFMEFCLHPGGHSFMTAYVTRAWREFDAAGAFDG